MTSNIARLTHKLTGPATAATQHIKERMNPAATISGRTHSQGNLRSSLFFLSFFFRSNRAISADS
jgi:hypothetical protein